jgi:glycosyltransferase involved in cell wall biosynthesis
MIRVSVCMATYNGSHFLREQLDSILSQLLPEDELIVSDDHSTDDTCSIVASYRDPRIRLITNPKRSGHVRNFSHAMANASGEFIALSDQDDIWVENRLERMLDPLRRLPRYSLVVSDFTEFDDNGVRPIRVPLGPSPANNFVQMCRLLGSKTKYFGCTYLFRRDLTRYVLPIPACIEAHDVWIPMNALIHGTVAHLEETTVMRRLHGNNLTPLRRRGWLPIIRSRVNYIVGMFRSSFR